MVFSNLLTYYLMLNMMKATYASYMQETRLREFERKQKLKKGKIY